MNNMKVHRSNPNFLNLTFDSGGMDGRLQKLLLRKSASCQIRSLRRVSTVSLRHHEIDNLFIYTRHVYITALKIDCKFAES
jgi:hypothetical protein